MDVMKRVEDLMNMALDERTVKEERLNSSLGALRLIREYGLLGKKRIDVAASIIERFTSPDFVEGVASRAEKVADGIERIVGSAKKISDRLSHGSGGGGRSGGRGRRYGGRER